MPDLSYLTGDAENPNVTPQSKAIPGREADMKENRAGGVGFVLDKWSTLQRFLILGTEGPTYYASQREMTKDNSANVLACIREDGLRTVRIVTEVSSAGRAPKNDQAIFCLALASVHGNEATRTASYQALPLVCRIGTHLFMFFEFRKALGKHQGGVTGGFQRAIRDWYSDKEPDSAAYQMVKYQQRGGVSHRDLLRLAKPVGKELSGFDPLFAWAVGKDVRTEDLPRIVQGFELAKVFGHPAAHGRSGHRVPSPARGTQDRAPE